jgi:hypothetical protein
VNELADLLRWPAEDGSASHYEERFRLAAERRLSLALSEAHGQSMEVAGSLVRTAAVLPSESLLRIADAPELAYRLQTVGMTEEGRAELTAFLCEALQAELLLLDPRVGSPGGDGVWTALGDVHIEADPKRRDEAPELTRGLSVDFGSPRNRADIVKRFPVYVAPPDERRAAAVQAMREALELIERTSAPARRFTEVFTRIVVCIEMSGNRHGSFSSRWFPGRTVLINVDRMEKTELTAALVHEAIHSLVGVSEVGGHLLRRPLSPEATVTSPWTGATLSPQPLLEAYFVWYGLLWFWRAAVESGAVDAATAETLCEEALRGFEAEFVDVVGDLLSAIHEETVTAIEELRLAVLKAGDVR